MARQETSIKRRRSKTRWKETHREAEPVVRAELAEVQMEDSKGSIKLATRLQAEQSLKKLLNKIGS